MNISNDLPEDIFGEIFNYIPYTIFRSLNKNFNIIADNNELINCQPLKYNDIRWYDIELYDDLFVKYIKSYPKKIIWSMGDLYYNFGYCYHNKCYIDYQYNIMPYTIDEILLEFSKTPKKNQFVMHIPFIIFLLNKRPLNQNINYMKKKLFVTIENFLNNMNFNDQIDYLEINTKISAMGDLACGNFERSKEIFFNKLKEINVTPINTLDNIEISNYLNTYDNVDNSETSNKVDMSNNLNYKFIFAGIIIATLLFMKNR